MPQVEALAGDVREALCRVSDLPFDEAASANVPTVAYEVSARHRLAQVYPVLPLIKMHTIDGACACILPCSLREGLPS